MEPRLNLESLTYDGIGDFISSAVEKSETAPLYLLGKAAAYVDIALTLGRISRPVALELRTIIIVHASVNDNHPFEYWEADKPTFQKATQSPAKPW